MTPLHDARGRATAFLAPRGTIVSRGGRLLARVGRGGAVHDARGRCIGWWRNGYIRGRDGGVMAWTRQARGLRVTPPMAGPTPMAPPLGILAASPILDTPPLVPDQRFAWSRESL